MCMCVFLLMMHREDIWSGPHNFKGLVNPEFKVRDRCSVMTGQGNASVGLHKGRSTNVCFSLSIIAFMNQS